MSGVEIHANAFNTLAGGEFLEPVSAAFALLAPVLLVGAAAAAFALLSGWPAYLAGGGIIIASHVIPHIAFRQGFVFPYTAPVMAAWLGVGTAAAWQYFVVRRQLWKSESDKARYQQAIHFVTHEMRSPLTAIQGSSELIGRYNLNEDKRKQVAEMINSESRRLARMIQTFLDIERLTDGQMELRSESFDVAGLIATCTKRAQALADRKGIELESGVITELSLTGDRELMEYALYNLLTNAVKYSPANTRVRVEAHGDASSVRVSVQDQGIGLEPQELKSIFKKFYRTRKAEASGEAGTGIGLSLVEQIVDHHGGRMDVTSAPGKGSCFTMVLPRSKNAPVVPASTTVSS
jgi:signal transduction histidine kinase